MTSIQQNWLENSYQMLRIAMNMINYNYEYVYHKYDYHYYF